MCLILHGRGHFTIKLLQEQIWPHLREDGEVAFLECYDLILRSHSNVPIDRLYLLSPQSPFPDQEVFALKSDHEIKCCDWVIEESSNAGSGTVAIEIASQEYKVVRLFPILARQQWLERNSPMSSAFGYTGMSLFRVTFQNNATIKPYDPENSAATTYWIRIAYVPKVNHVVREAMRFGRGDSILKVRPCMILSPNLVIEHLGNQLQALATENVLSEGAEKAREEALEKLMLAKDTSTRIEDHRITLVTSPEFLVLNTLAEGACSFVGIENVEGTPPRIARTWITGARYQQENDPLFLARTVYRYLLEWALNERDAKTKEAITSAAAPGNHANVSHVVEALRHLGYVQESGDRRGYYFIKKPALEHGKLFLSPLENSSDMDLGHRDAEIRGKLYGDLPVSEDRISELSRFKPRGVKINFDLAYY